MKLVEIKDARRGQIWKREGEYIVLPYVGSYSIDAFQREGVLYVKTQHGRDVIIDGGYLLSPEDEDFILCGKLGITHEVKYGKLVEIPRADFEVDDIVHFSLFSGQFIGDGVVVAANSDVESEKGWLRVFDGEEIHYLVRPFDKVKKIGVLGITHELVNEREV